MIEDSLLRDDDEDAMILMRAALAIVSRCRNPSRIAVRVAVKVLTDIAVDIRRGKAPVLR